MDLSIIVPAYNTEKWISQCLTSLCKPNYRPDQFEVIVINDGSPDDLESIVLELQKKYTNIRYIKQKNGRQGKARNTGLASARGRYIAFVDSDDCWTNEETISILISLADQYHLDIISSSEYHSFTGIPKKQNYIANGIEIYSREQFLEKIRHFSVWISFYSSQVIKNIHFRENCFFEDLDYVYKAIWTVGVNGKIGVIRFPFYGYRQNPHSTTNTYQIQTFIDNCIANDLVFRFCRSRDDMSSECMENLYARFQKSLLTLLSISRHYPLKESRKALKQIDLVSLFRETGKTGNWKQHVIINTYRLSPPLVLLTIRVLTLIKRFITR